MKTIEDVPTEWLVQIKRQEKGKWVKPIHFLVYNNRLEVLGDYANALKDCKRGEYYDARIIRRITMVDVFETYRKEKQ